jgi:hypothetical protein
MGGNVKRGGWNGLEIPEAAIICNNCITTVDVRADFCDGCDRNGLTFSSLPSMIPFYLIEGNSFIKES